MPDDPNALLAIIRNAIAPQPDEIPPGWKHSGELAEGWGLSQSRAEAIIYAAVRKGVLQRRKMMASDGRRRYYYAQADPH